MAAGLKLGGRHVPRPAALIRAEAERFLAREGSKGARVYRVEQEAPRIVWLLFATAAQKARYMVVAGDGPSSWEKISEGSGWPVV